MNNKLGITFLVIYALYIVWTLLNAFPAGNPVINVNEGCEEPVLPDECLVTKSTGNTTL
jgi:hypothetical protein